ncbi:MAG: 2-oxoacid:acceptor oxidoreductase subunit alpha [Bacteroidales bacterium]|nr:2-oxoacid:acceptor oxidoreductase subunit alpha [Bacteroidales bacterium]MBN2763592.1 2-oxoacid:acceptor oxidoreductase subunit alpha [Bacteroidales bacterium]
MKRKVKVVERDTVVVKFAGDSGDGIQLTGSQFSDTSAFIGNDLATFPDYPAEIRAPQGTIAGVSGFQVHIGHKEVQTPGDKADVLVAMNPAALKANMKWIKSGATIIIDMDNFDTKHYKRAEYVEDPLFDGSLEGYNIIKAPITDMTRDVVKKFGLDAQTADKTKNQFVAGLLFWLFNRDIKIGEQFLRERFENKPELIDANIEVLHAGYHYAETLEAIATVYKVKPSEKGPGLYRNINGNVAAAWGLLAAAEKAKCKLYLGSYPITPASDILHEIAKMKHLGAIAFQAEDEIAGVCSAIGASFAGCLGVTSTSGPGLSLKSEGIGLAVITELPLVVIDVQRGGPSTGLPTKTEQADLMQALYGRHGESPCIVLAALTPVDCFYMAYEAARISMEHMTPVILLSDGYLANGSELWKIPKVNDLPDIQPPLVKDNDPSYQPYNRNPENLARYWAVPGQEGLRHRIGGLEKADVTGEISYDPFNHEIMTFTRDDKIKRVAERIPKHKVMGEEEGDLLVVGWGGTYGALYTAVKEMQAEKHRISLAQFRYINPLPANTAGIFSGFKKIVVCELNMGQFAAYLRSQLPQFNYLQFNKIQGLPFLISELKTRFREILNEKKS